MFEVNYVEGYRQMSLNVALAAGVKKMLYARFRWHALGRIREDTLINETMNWTPETSNSAYGQSKFLAGNAGLAWRR
jgi:hypothetical protein